jgi:DNA-binding NarL/FixJ family response regulator
VISVRSLSHGGIQPKTGTTIRQRKLEPGKAPVLINTKKQKRIAVSSVKKTTVLLAEDQATFRKSLKLLVELDGDIEVVGEAKNGREAVRLGMRLRPDVIVMDIAMPLLNGLQATQQIMTSFPAARVLILSAHPEPEYIMQAVILGASGYLIKQSSAHVLANAVREVLKGNSFFCAPISKPLRDKCRKVFGKSELLKKKAARLALTDRSRAC